mgnify:CR=1 FL=1
MITRIDKPENISFKTTSLDDYLNQRYEFKANTESLRQEVLNSVEYWYIQNRDLWEWERNENYRKDILEQVQKIKLNIYTDLISQ